MRCAALVVTMLFWASGFAVAEGKLGPFPDRPGCSAVVFEGARFTVCRYRAAADELRLANSGPNGPLRSLAGLQRVLGADSSRVVFAMNAGMYDRARRPVGLFVERGRVMTSLNTAIGAGNFFLLPNGVFWIGRDGAAHVEETTAFAAAHRQPVWATQSGPLLLDTGALNPQIAADGSSLLILNGVGVRGGDGYFVISDDKVSFGRFARLFRDRLNCPNALYLDGTVSSLWAPSAGRLDGRRDLGTFAVVLRRHR